MFKNLEAHYDSNKKIYTISGFSVGKLSRLFNKYISRNKKHFLLIDDKVFSISFYDFFILEIVLMLEEILKIPNRFASINKKEVKALVDNLKETSWLREHYDLKPIENSHIDYENIEKMLSWKIMSHQMVSFDFFNKVKHRADLNGGYLNAAVGSGKTFMSLALAEGLISDKIVVVVPKQASNKPWVDAMQTDMYKKKQSYFSTTINRPEDYNNERIIIIHYEAIKKMIPFINKLLGGKITFIIDEFHNFNEIKSNRTTELHVFHNGINPDNTILMTGTAIKAKATEFASMLRLIDKKFTPVIEKRFLKVYMSPSEFLTSTLPIRFKGISVKISKSDMVLPEIITGYINVELDNVKDFTLTNIAKEMKKYMDEKRKHYKPLLPKYTEIYNHLLELGSSRLLESKVITKKELKYYKENIKDIKIHYKKKTLSFVPHLLVEANGFENKIDNVLDNDDKKSWREAKTIYKYLDLKIRGMVLANVVMRTRIEAFKSMALKIDYRKYMDSTLHKTIVFSNYVEVLDNVSKMLKKENYIKVYGKDTKYLSSNVESFLHDKKVNPLLASLKSLSTGVPLYKANVSIFIDKPFRVHELEQAIARTRRLGQVADEVYVFHVELVSDEPTIVSRGSDIVEWSRKQVESLTGDEVNVEIIQTVTEELGLNLEIGLDVPLFKKKEYKCIEW